jgi:hypothetical protein
LKYLPNVALLVVEGGTLVYIGMTLGNTGLIVVLTGWTLSNFIKKRWKESF